MPIQFRRSTASNWQAQNPVLADGEPGLETDTVRLKIGDGVTPWNSLGYAFDEVFTKNDKNKLAEIPPIKPQELKTNGAVTSSICLIGGTATTVSLPSTKSGIKYTTLTNLRSDTIMATGPLSPAPHVRGAKLNTSSLTASDVVASSRYSGIADGKNLLLSVVAKPDVQNAYNTMLFANNGWPAANTVDVTLGGKGANSNALNVRAYDRTGFKFLDVKYDITQGVTQHWLLSVNLAIPLIQFAINGVLQTPSPTVFPASGDRYFMWNSNSAKTFYVGGNGSNERFPWRGILAQLYINMDTALDLSIPSNIGKFYDGMRPKDFGSNGSLPTGSVPQIFLNDTAEAFFTSPKAGAAFTIDANALAGGWIVAPAADALLWNEDNINGYSAGYALPAGKTVSFVRMSSGSWEVI